MQNDNLHQDDTSHYEGAILEDIQHQLQRLAESMAEVPGDVRQLKQDAIELKSDMKVVKAAVVDLSRTVNDHDLQLARLQPSV